MGMIGQKAIKECSSRYQHKTETETGVKEKNKQLGQNGFLHILIQIYEVMNSLTLIFKRKYAKNMAFDIYLMYLLLFRIGLLI